MQTIWAKSIRYEKNHTIGFYYYGKDVEENTSLEILASSVYRLMINGELVGYGPARAAHHYVRKDVYNLSKYAYKNIHIVVEVFACNVNSYYIVDEPPFFGGVLKTYDKIIATTDHDDFDAYLISDRVQKVQRYSFQRPFAECYRMNQCRSLFYNGDLSFFKKVETVKVNGNIVIERNVSYPTFDTISYQKMIESGQVSINPNKLVWKNRSLENINESLKGFPYEELEVKLSDEASHFEFCAKQEEKTGFIPQSSYQVYDFGRSLTGFFDLKLIAKKDSTVYILWDEIIWNQKGQNQKEKNVCFYRNDCCNVIRYSLKAGEYKLLTYEPTTAQFVKVVVLDGEIMLNALNMVLYENSEVYRLKFQCEDEKLMSIVKAAANTLSHNAVDVLTDCPSRERAGWLCDSYFSGRAEMLFTGDVKTERNFLENYYLAPQLKELPTGMIPMCYPADHYDRVYIPNYAMWYIIELNDYLRRTGDLELIENSKVKVYAIVEFFKKYLNSDGLLEDLESWVFIEWSKANDKEFLKGVNYPSNMLYYGMLNAIGNMYDDQDCIKKAKQIKNVIIEQSYNGVFFEDNRIRENGDKKTGQLNSLMHTTETCQYYAFYFGIADRSSFPELFETMVQKFGPNRDDKREYPTVYKSNAIVGNYLRLEILLRNGLTLQVLNECKDFFTFMALKTGTLWEHSYESASLNHGFASIAANHIIECITGFVNVDHRKKEIYLIKPTVVCDTHVEIPILDDYLTIDITDGKRIVIKPEGYSIVAVDEKMGFDIL